MLELGRDIDAVVFDMGGVFFLPDHQRVFAALADAGLDVPSDPAVYHRAHYEGVRAYDTSSDEPETWPAYLAGYLRWVGVPVEDLGVARTALERVWHVPAHLHWTWVQDDAVLALRHLAGRDVPLAVVSNCDGTAERCLAGTGVCQVGPGPGVEVAAIVDSDVVGIRKPHPAIFEPAIEAVGTEPERTLYLGDTVRNDVDGARAAGLRPVHLDPYDLHADADHDRVRSVLDLARSLAR